MKNKEILLEKPDFDLEATESANYTINLRNPKHEKYTIYLHVRQKDIEANFNIKAVLTESITTTLFVCVRAHAGATGASSELDMRAIITHPDASLTFVPSLEIDEMDVSVDHKSSIGRPPEQWLYYLQSRGLSSTDAATLLTDSML